MKVPCDALLFPMCSLRWKILHSLRLTHNQHDKLREHTFNVDVCVCVQSKRWVAAFFPETIQQQCEQASWFYCTNDAEVNMCTCITVSLVSVQARWVLRILSLTACDLDWHCDKNCTPLECSLEFIWSEVALSINLFQRWSLRFIRKRQFQEHKHDKHIWLMRRWFLLRFKERKAMLKS